LGIVANLAGIDFQLDGNRQTERGELLQLARATGERLIVAAEETNPRALNGDGAGRVQHAILTTSKTALELSVHRRT